VRSELPRNAVEGLPAKMLGATVRLSKANNVSLSGAKSGSTTMNWISAGSEDELVRDGIGCRLTLAFYPSHAQ
jgi:hypothetical protein